MIHPQKTNRNFLYVGFDGQIHSFSSGWRGATAIGDSPVPGAVRALVGAAREYEVVVVSERMHWPGGRTSVWEWLRSRIALSVGMENQIAIMAHVHLMAPPVRNDDLNSGDALVGAPFLSLEEPSDDAEVCPGPPSEPGGDSQHI